MKILIDNGHGENTPGKRSPDSTFFEWSFAREIANEVYKQLVQKGHDAKIIVPEQTDVSLQERCNRVNNVCKSIKPNEAILISIHANAAGMGDWMQARGWECYTTPGKTKSDNLAECLYKEAEKTFAGMKIRKDMTDKDSDKEANFYILKHTSCPAVLTENFFYDNREDLIFLKSDEGKKQIVDVHVQGIINYLKSIGEN